MGEAWRWTVKPSALCPGSKVYLPHLQGTGELFSIETKYSGEKTSRFKNSWVTVVHFCITMEWNPQEEKNNSNLPSLRLESLIHNYNDNDNNYFSLFQREILTPKQPALKEGKKKKFLPYRQSHQPHCQEPILGLVKLPTLWVICKHQPGK